MEQEYYSKSDGEEHAYDKKLQYLLCRKYPEGATKHSWEFGFSPILNEAFLIHDVNHSHCACSTIAMQREHDGIIVMQWCHQALLLSTSMIICGLLAAELAEDWFQGWWFRWYMVLAQRTSCGWSFTETTSIHSPECTGVHHVVFMKPNPIDIPSANTNRILACTEGWFGALIQRPAAVKLCEVRDKFLVVSVINKSSHIFLLCIAQHWPSFWFLPCRE